MQRIISIDVLRGFSLTGMVVCHYMLEYGDAHAPESLLYFIMDHALGDFGAVWFLLLVGVSQVVSGDRKKKMGEINLMKMAFLRGHSGHSVLMSRRSSIARTPNGWWACLERS